MLFRSGNPDAAKADIAKLAELRDKLREAKDAYWAEQVDIQWQVATAWVLYAEGKFDDALKAMSAAADAEDKTEKHPVTPGVPEPARELYGVMLLERDKPAEALVAFEARHVAGIALRSEEVSFQVERKAVVSKRALKLHGPPGWAGYDEPLDVQAPPADEVISAVGKRLRSRLRAADAIGRFAGDRKSVV